MARIRLGMSVHPMPLARVPQRDSRGFREGIGRLRAHTCGQPQHRHCAAAAETVIFSALGELMPQLPAGEGTSPSISTAALSIPGKSGSDPGTIAARRTQPNSMEPTAPACGFLPPNLYLWSLTVVDGGLYSTASQNR